MKRILFYLGIIGVASVSFLFSPPLEKNPGPDKDCPVQFVELSDMLGFRMTCDAIEFTGLSVNPGLLLEDNNRRQSRPLYILAGTILGRLIFFISTPFHHQMASILPDSLATSLPQQKAAFYMSHYIGLVILNILVLIIALYIFEKLVFAITGPWRNGQIIRASILFLLVSNNITKVFLFAPHQQVFNILLPLLAFFLILEIGKNGNRPVHAFLYGISSGILLLFYGSYLFLLPVIILSFLHFGLTERDKIWRILGNGLISAVSFFIPLLLWIGILKIRGVDFYSHETSYYRQFIWIFDAIGDPGREAISELISSFPIYLSTFMPIIPPAIFLLVCIVTVKGSAANAVSATRSEKITALLAVSLFFFFWLLGFYADRLIHTFGPLLICQGALLLNRMVVSRVIVIIISSLVISWHVFLMFTEMPYFSDRYYF